MKKLVGRDKDREITN